MPEHDDAHAQLRREFLRQAPAFDMRSTLSRRVSATVRRRQILHLAVPLALAVAVVVAVAIPLANLRSSSPGRKNIGPAASAVTTTVATTTTTTAATTTTTGPTTTSTPWPATQQVTYQPFTGTAVDPTLHVTSQSSGPCSQYGGGADGRLYYRCGTMQPCFAGPQGTGSPLVCPARQDPTTDDVVLWMATSVATAGYIPATAKTPWAMQLSNGTVCSFVNAAWGGLGPYDCQIEAARIPADCRQPQPSAGMWTAACQDDTTQASPFASVVVVKVWF